ncbi:mechanosensitive ion channel family protein [Cryptosporidium serpentis]
MNRSSINRTLQNPEVGGVEVQSGRGSEAFFRTPSVVAQDIKKEEEEEEEEEDPRSIWLRLFLPDLSPLGGLLVIGIALCIVATYLKGTGVERPFCYPLLVFFTDLFIYICIMCTRHLITIYSLTQFGEGRFFAAVSGSLDPELVYCLWSGLCLILWMSEVRISNDNTNSILSTSTLYSSHFFENISSALRIPKVPWDVIQVAHIILVIMTVRRLLLSIITFYFRLDFIMSINPQVVEFLRLYSLLRRIDTKWCLIKPHIQKQEFQISSTEIEGINSSKNGNFLQNKDTNTIIGTINVPSVPSMLIDSNIERTAKSSSENWLALQFIKQYNVALFIDDMRYELKTKQQARDCAKYLFHDILQNVHAIMLYHYIGRMDHVNPISSLPPKSDSYSILGEDTFCHALIDFEDRHDIKNDFNEKIGSNSNLSDKILENKQQISETDNLLDKNNQTSINKNSQKIGSAPTALPNSILDILYDKPLGDLIKQIDTARRGQVTEEEWIRFFVGIYDTRKKILRAATSQEGIVQVFRRMVSIFLWFFTGIIILLMLGIDVNTLVISGAAIISSLSVGLSYIYSNFFSAVIFVIFLNPYNVGDRIRVNNGGAMIVKKIETFYTEFHTTHESPVLIPHSWLSSQMIYNESRSKRCSSDIQFKISDTTSPFSIEALGRAIQDYVTVRPSEFVASNFWCGITEIQPGHYATVFIWITNTDPFHNRRKLMISKSKLLLFILHTLRQLGIQYTLPITRVRLEQNHGTTMPILWKDDITTKSG